MISKRSKLCFTLVLGWLVLLHSGLSGLTQAASLNLEVKDSVVSLHAEQVPLISILENIADRTDMLFETTEPLREPVTLELRDATIEECIKRLLVNRSYSLEFRKAADNYFILTGLRIFGSGSRSNQKPVSMIRRTDKVSRPREKSPASEPANSDFLANVPASVFDGFGKDWFEQAFEDTDELVAQVSVETTDQEPDPGGFPPKNLPEQTVQEPARDGILIRNLSEQSAFAAIGLEKGDTIRIVNGKPVETIEGFISILQNLSKEPTRIRIDRFRENGIIYPIYIELQTPTHDDGSDPLREQKEEIRPVLSDTPLTP